MPISKKNQSSSPASQAAPPSGTRRVLGMKDSSALPSKRTLNLCMHESEGMSIEAFLLILSIILIVIILIELAGVYFPYKNVEALEAQLAAQQAVLDDKNNKMKDYDEVEEYYNNYNYNGFDLSIADRLDVLAVLEREIINKQWTHKAANGDEETYYVTLTSASINGRNLTISIRNIYGDQISALELNLEKDPLVERATHGSISYQTDKKVDSLTITITLADASTVSTAA